MNLWELTDLATPWCAHVVVTLRVAEHIAAGKTDIANLAEAAGADAPSLVRVMRQLVSKGVFEEPAAGTFTLNDNARQLLSSPARLGMDLNGMGGRMAHSWGTLLTAVRTGRPAYHEVFGRGFWEDLDGNPDLAASFDEMMGPAGHGVPDPDVLLDPDDWKTVGSVTDIGGGTGALLAEVLRAHPHVRGTLVDLPRAVERSAAVFAAAGVADRATAVGGSFFDPLPKGSDVYLLSRVLHDWPDEEATAILRRCAEAAGSTGRVVAVTGVTGEERAPAEMLMLVLVGGKARTLAEFEEIAKKAGLGISASGPNRSGRFMVECRCG